MVKYPLFKTSYRIECVAPNLVFLISSHGTHVLEGTAYYHVAPLLDGTRSVAEIADELGGLLPFMSIHRALLRLADKGYVVENEARLSAEIQPLIHRLNVEPKIAAARLAETTVGVLSIGDLNITSLQKQLAQYHIHIENDTQADFVIVVTEDYLSPELAQVNEKFLLSGTPWMLVRPQTDQLWIGPAFGSDENGCWACLAQRLSLHRRAEQFLQKEQQTDRPFPPPALRLPAMSEVAYSFAALEVFRWIVEGSNTRIEENLLELDITTMEINRHHFVKRKQCSICGDANIVAERQRLPVELQSRRKRFTTDGGHRILTPDQTVAKYEKHVSHLTGVVNALNEIAQEDNGLIHGFGCGVNIKGQPEDYAHLRGLLDGGDGGKGASRIQAKASGLCESIERYSGSFHGDELRIEATYQDIRDQAIHPYRLLNFSEAQYVTAHDFNKTVSGYNFVPPRFNEDEVVEWTPVWSLTQKAFKYIPTSYLYFNFSRNPAVPACSNGNAAGNCIEEAILQGFFELVERDAVGIWWYNRIQREAVALESFENRYICDLVKHYRTLGYELWALNLTTDLDIPVFAGIARRTDHSTENILLGFGAHFDPDIAMLRTLTEVNQGLCQFLTEDGLDKIPDFNIEAEEWWQTATVSNQPYLAPREGRPAYRADFATQWSDDVKHDVQRCVDIVAQRGMETLVLDQTQPDVGLSVVKVMVPGMRHFWRRLGPGRLFDVPLKMGWLDQPLPEAQLNPLNIHF